MTISLGAVEHNARVIKKRLSPGVMLAAVVKADAYGHGAAGVAERLARRGLADAFAVATYDEGASLSESGGAGDKPILVLGAPMDDSQAEIAVARGLCACVYDEAGLLRLARAADKLGAQASAQLKLDTGMSRIGVRSDGALDRLLSAWTRAGNVRMWGAFTHFCAADTDEEFTRLQNSRFARFVQIIHARGFRPVLSAAASSAVHDASYMYDMARPGIALYGTGARALEGELLYAQRLTARPARIEWIGEADTVGYSRLFTAQRPTRVITIPCGYGDGYPRALGGRASVLVNGRRAPVIGSVCMDMIMADITDAGDVDMDSEVTLLGAQGDERITPDELACLAGTIPYEIMLGFLPRVTRRQV